MAALLHAHPVQQFLLESFLVQPSSLRCDLVSWAGGKSSLPVYQCSHCTYLVGRTGVGDVNAIVATMVTGQHFGALGLSQASFYLFTPQSPTCLKSAQRSKWISTSAKHLTRRSVSESWKKISSKQETMRWMRLMQGVHFSESSGLCGETEQ